MFTRRRNVSISSNFHHNKHYQARRQRPVFRRRQNRVGAAARRPGQRRVQHPRSGLPWRQRHAAAGRRPGPQHRADRADPGRGRGRSLRRRLPPDAARVHPLPRAAQRAAARAPEQDRRRVVDERVSEPARLARQRQRQPGLFAGRPDPERVGQGHRQLLAQPRLSARSGRRPPQRRPAHPRSGHAVGLLRRLVAAHAVARGFERRARQDRVEPAQAHVERDRADRQFPRHAAERVGRRAGVQFLRHLHGALHPQGQSVLCRRQAVHPGADLQPQRAVALGYADAVHQSDFRLGLPGGFARAGAGHRRRRDAVHLRRSASGDGHDQPRLYRDHDGGRRQGPRVHLPDPDV